MPSTSSSSSRQEQHLPSPSGKVIKINSKESSSASVASASVITSSIAPSLSRPQSTRHDRQQRTARTSSSTRSAILDGGSISRDRGRRNRGHRRSATRQSSSSDYRIDSFDTFLYRNKLYVNTILFSLFIIIVLREFGVIGLNKDLNNFTVANLRKSEAVQFNINGDSAGNEIDPGLPLEQQQQQQQQQDIRNNGADVDNGNGNRLDEASTVMDHKSPTLHDYLQLQDHLQEEDDSSTLPGEQSREEQLPKDFDKEHNNVELRDLLQEENDSSMLPKERPTEEKEKQLLDPNVEQKNNDNSDTEQKRSDNSNKDAEVDFKKSKRKENSHYILSSRSKVFKQLHPQIQRQILREEKEREKQQQQQQEHNTTETQQSAPSQNNQHPNQISEEERERQSWVTKDQRMVHRKHEHAFRQFLREEQDKRIERQNKRQQQQQGKQRPIINTFFEYIPIEKRGTRMTDQADQELITLWKQSWYDAGFEPQIITLKDATNHPDYASYKPQLNDVPMMGQDGKGSNIFYNQLCFLRYLAMASVGGGYFADYDVFPLMINVTTTNAPKLITTTFGQSTPPERFTVYSVVRNSVKAGIPCLMGGTSNEWTRMANILLKNGLEHNNKVRMWSDMMAMIDIRENNEYNYEDSVLEAQEMITNFFSIHQNHLNAPPSSTSRTATTITEKEENPSLLCKITKNRNAIHISHESMRLSNITTEYVHDDGNIYEDRITIMKQILTYWRQKHMSVRKRIC